MKRTLCIFTLVGLVASPMASFAQNNPSARPAAAANAAATATAHRTGAASADVPAAEAVLPGSIAAAAVGQTAAVGAADSAPGAEAAAPGATASKPSSTLIVANNAAPAATPATTNETNAASAATGTNAPQAAVIPLIVMDDVPLTDAIKNLARQAGLNYMLDPKVSFGQATPGQPPVPQPSVSIRWENVTAEQALDALLKTYNLQLVRDPKTHIDLVTTRDPAAPEPLVTKIVQLKYASPSNIVANVQGVLTDKRSKVLPDVRTSQLVVLATEKEQDEVAELVDRLDRITKQVLIEARLLETSMNPSTIKGVDWTGTLEGQTVRFGNNLQQNSASSSLNNTLSQTFPTLLFDTAKGFNPATAFLDMNGVNAVVNYLNKYAESKVISAPRTVTLDNEPAQITVTTAQPIFMTTAGTQGSPGGSQVIYTNLGVILNVTPRISANNYVNLKVIPEVSRVSAEVTKTVSGQVNQADAFAIRRVDTRVMIPSGNTLVLGGLLADDVEIGNTKVPIVGDIPVLGRLFRNDSKSRTKANLLIFITPTIVQEEDYQPTPSDFLKTPVPVTDTVDGPWSAYDSGQPYDWSKPAFEKEKTGATSSDSIK